MIAEARSPHLIRPSRGTHRFGDSFCTLSASAVLQSNAWRIVLMARSARIFWLTLLLILVFLISARLPFSRWERRGSTTPPSSTTAPREGLTEEKRLVVASLKGEDTTWLRRRLPDWPVSRYIVDDKEANLTVPIRKGRESMVYLT